MNAVEATAVKGVAGVKVTVPELASLSWDALCEIDELLRNKRDLVLEAKREWLVKQNRSPFADISCSGLFSFATHNIPSNSSISVEEQLKRVRDVLFCKGISILCIQEASPTMGDEFERVKAVLFQGQLQNNNKRLFDYKMLFVRCAGQGAKHMCFIYDSVVWDLKPQSLSLKVQFKETKVSRGGSVASLKSRFIEAIFCPRHFANSNLELCFVNIHLKSNEHEVAVSHLAQLLQVYSGKENVILCGDLNIPPSKYKDVMSNQEFGQIHSLEIGPDGHDFKDNILYKLKDWIGPKLAVHKNCIVQEVRRPESDHVPVYGVFKLVPSRSCENVQPVCDGARSNQCEIGCGDFFCLPHLESCICGLFAICVKCCNDVFQRCVSCKVVVHGSCDTIHLDAFDLQMERIDNLQTIEEIKDEDKASFCFPYEFRNGNIVCKSCIIKLSLLFPEESDEES